MNPEKFIEIVENLKEGERIYFVGEKGIEVSIVNLTCAFKMDIGSAYLVKFAKIKVIGDRFVDLLDENGGLVCGIDCKYLEFEEKRTEGKRLTEFNPCPFCGSENIGSTYIDGGAGGLLRYVVFCKECMGSIISLPTADIRMTHLYEAKAKWNRRVSE